MSLLDQLFQYSCQTNSSQSILSLLDFGINTNIQPAMLSNQNQLFQKNQSQTPKDSESENNDSLKNSIVSSARQISVLDMLTETKLVRMPNKKHMKIHKFVSIINSKILKLYYEFFVNQGSPSQPIDQKSGQNEQQHKNSLKSQKNIQQIKSFFDTLIIFQNKIFHRYQQSTKLKAEFEKIKAFRNNGVLFQKLEAIYSKNTKCLLRFSMSKLKQRQIYHSKLQVFLKVWGNLALKITNNILKNSFSCILQSQILRVKAKQIVILTISKPKKSYEFSRSKSNYFEDIHFHYDNSQNMQKFPLKLQPAKVHPLETQINDINDQIHLFLPTIHQIDVNNSLSRIKSNMSWNGSSIKQIQEKIQDLSAINLLELEEQIFAKNQISMVKKISQSEDQKIEKQTKSLEKQERIKNENAQMEKSVQFSTKSKGQDLFRQILLDLDERFSKLSLSNKKSNIVSQNFKKASINQRKASLHDSNNILRSPNTDSLFQPVHKKHIELKNRKSLTIQELEKDKKLIEVLIEELKKTGRKHKKQHSTKSNPDEQIANKKKKVIQTIEKITNIEERGFSVGKGKISSKKMQSLKNSRTKPENTRNVTAKSQKNPPRKKRISASENINIKNNEVSILYFEKDKDSSQIQQEKIEINEFQEDISLGQSYIPLFQKPFQQIISTPNTKRSNDKGKINIIGDYYKQKQISALKSESVKNKQILKNHKNEEKKCISIKLKKNNEIKQSNDFNKDDSTRKDNKKDDRKLKSKEVNLQKLISQAQKKSNQLKIQPGTFFSKNKENYEEKFVSQKPDFCYHSNKSAATKLILQHRLSFNVRECLLQSNPKPSPFRKGSVV